jgi:hypothetical protein
MICQACGASYTKQTGNTKILCRKCIARRTTAQKHIITIQKESKYRCEICDEELLWADLVTITSRHATRYRIFCKNCCERYSIKAYISPEDKPNFPKCRICQKELTPKDHGATCNNCRVLSTRLKKKVQKYSVEDGQCFYCGKQTAPSHIHFLYNKSHSKCLMFCQECFLEIYNKIKTKLLIDYTI